MFTAESCRKVGAAAIAAWGMAVVASADVFHMGGTRNPDGSWTDLAGLQTVRVGNPGNGPDQNYNYGARGAVSYVYYIGKYEVTNAQYAAFLSAKATSDPYALYNAEMTTNARGGIIRSGSSPNYTYSVKSGFENMPVVYVCWFDAIRFANWLTNGQGNGDTESGSYAITGGGPNWGTVTVPDAAQRAAWAQGSRPYWFLPSEDEWYKAAYFQPASSGGDTDSYWLYPTRTNSSPYSDQPPGSGAPLQSNTGNFNSDDGVPNGYNDGFAVTGSTWYDSAFNYLTDVGAYTASSSYYGTFDQAGNVWEWNDGLLSGVFRGVRGGSWDNNAACLAANYANYNDPVGAYQHYGFRVAAVSTAPPPVPPTAVAGGPYMFCPQWPPLFLDGSRSSNPDDGRSEPGLPGDFIRAYEWDLDGDGQFDDASGPRPDVTAYFASHTTGTYPVSLKVTDNTAASFPGSGLGDLSSIDSATVIVPPALPDSDGDGVGNACDLCPNTPPGGRVRATGCAPGDFDADGDVDLSDFSVFSSCFNGPNRPYARSGCTGADVDDDADVDLSDFNVFAQCFNGPNRPPACSG